MGKTPSSHIIHSLGGEYCWIVRDSEPIKLLKSPRWLSVYMLMPNGFALHPACRFCETWKVNTILIDNSAAPMLNFTLAIWTKFYKSLSANQKKTNPTFCWCFCLCKSFFMKFTIAPSTSISFCLKTEIFSLRFGLPSTRIPPKRSQETYLF